MDLSIASSRFRTRSVTAFTLQSGMNWSQFLGLGDIAPSAQSRMLPQDEDVKWTIELPAVRANAVKAPPPVREITAQLDDTVAHADMIPAASNTPDREIFEYFPRIRQRQAIPLGGATMVEADDEEKDEEEEAEDEPDPICESKTPLPADLTLPYPSGPHWNRLCDDAKYRKLQVSRIQLEDCEEEQQYQAMRAYYSAIRDTEVPPLALMCRALVSEQCSLDEVSDLLDSIAMVGHLPEASDVPDLITRVAYKAQKKRRKTVAESGDRRTYLTLALRLWQRTRFEPSNPFYMGICHSSLNKGE